VSATLRTANESITPVTPLMIMLTPTSLVLAGVVHLTVASREASSEFAAP
jgi:hypothetical protein